MVDVEEKVELYHQEHGPFGHDKLGRANLLILYLKMEDTRRFMVIWD